MLGHALVVVVVVVAESVTVVVKSMDQLDRIKSSQSLPALLRNGNRFGVVVVMLMF